MLFEVIEEFGPGFFATYVFDCQSKVM